LGKPTLTDSNLAIRGSSPWIASTAPAPPRG
jgi:hypothetical protein